MTTATIPRISSWNWHKLLIIHVGILICGASYFWGPTRAIWDAIDSGVFCLLNGSLGGNPHWQIFWAMANHSLADWVSDIFFLSFFIASVYAHPKEKRLEQTAKILFLCLYGACIIFFINRILFRQYLHIPRLSPTLVFPESIKLSHEVTWLKIKDSAKQSFPGDHGTTAIFFAAAYAGIAPRRLKILGWCYGLFLCLPRMITGAHWLSDIILGSGVIVVFFLSWLFYTPFFSYCTLLLTRCFRVVGSLRTRQIPTKTLPN